jgi:GNAT superfamily N-acetyltransferase
MLANYQILSPIENPRDYSDLVLQLQTEVEGLYPELKGKKIPHFQKEISFESKVVLKVDSEPMALAEFSISKKDLTLELLHFYVQRNMRGIGYGKTLLEHVESQAMDADCERVLVNLFNCHDGVDQLFDENGYQIVPNDELDCDDTSFILMEKIL